MQVSESLQTKQTSLESLCRYFDKEVKTDSGEVEKFVGLRYQNEELEIHFPVGYSKVQEADEKQKEKLLRKDILNLISILSTYGKKDEMITQADFIFSKKEVCFPIHAYIFIITDFMNHGYYKQKESFYKRGTTGKINWARTIKQVRPSIVNEQAVYFNFITKHINYNEEDLITKIHQYCVAECFKKLGFLFCSYVPEKAPIKLNKKLFITVLKSKMASTFNENNLLLFKNMIEVINFLDNDNNDKKEYIYGTNYFHHIWETLVDEVYGEEDKENYYPKIKWHFTDGKEDFTYSNSNDKKNSLRPDTIMITNPKTSDQKIFVLDSKYYQYGETHWNSNLPGSDSIVKQIAYAQYIEKSKTNPNCKIDNDIKACIKEKSIYNAFILPADKDKHENSLPQNVGYATTDYIDEDKTYAKIHCILLDTKTLMQNHARKSSVEIERLAALISL